LETPEIQALILGERATARNNAQLRTVPRGADLAQTRSASDMPACGMTAVAHGSIVRGQVRAPEGKCLQGHSRK